MSVTRGPQSRPVHVSHRAVAILLTHDGQGLRFNPFHLVNTKPTATAPMTYILKCPSLSSTLTFVEGFPLPLTTTASSIGKNGSGAKGWIRPQTLSTGRVLAAPN